MTGEYDEDDVYEDAGEFGDSEEEYDDKDDDVDIDFDKYDDDIEDQTGDDSLG